MAMSPTTKFPKVQGGGSLMLAWQIRNKPVLVIGGGEVFTPPPSHHYETWPGAD
jgi:hypothetical protein